MNEKNSKIFMKVYEEFRAKLIENINSTDNSLFTQNSEECYLIEESWINEYINFFNKYDKDNGSFEINYSFSKNKPIFINDFKSIITYLKNEKKLRLINKKLIELLYETNDLINLSVVKYYGGNDKIIIEYKDKEDKALLIFNPLNQNSIKNRIFILSININQKLLLYKDLLSEKNNTNILSNQKYQRVIISFENYLNNVNNSNEKTPQKQNNQSLNNKKESFKKEILKILIYIFYYKKYLIEEKGKVFAEINDYYIINPEWFIKYLEYYDYQNIYQPLLNISRQNPSINYNNINRFINSIVNIYLKKNYINFEKEKFKDLSNIQNIFAKVMRLNNNLSLNNCYIIPSNIINLIKTIEFPNRKFQDTKKIFVNNDYIYFIDCNKIIIGMLHKDLFNPHYILSYNTCKILESEKDIISSNTIEEYIKLRNCDINNKQNQDLISKNIKIGELISLHIAIINQNYSVNLNYKKIPSSKIPKKYNSKNSINIINKINNNNLKKNIIFKKQKCSTPRKTPSNNSINIVYTNPNEKKISNILYKNKPINHINANKRNQIEPNESNERTIENNDFMEKSEQRNLGKEFMKNIYKNENKNKEISIDKDKHLKNELDNNKEKNLENDSLKNMNIQNEELKNECNKLKEEINEKENQIKILKNENSKQNEEKNKIILQKENIIIDLNKKYINIEKELENKEFELNNKIKVIYEIREKIKEKDNEITFLKQNVLNIRQYFENVIEEQKNKYEIKISEIMNKNKNLEKLNNEIINKIKNYEIKEKNEQLKKYNKFTEKEKKIQKKIKDLDLRKSNLEKESELIIKEKKQIEKNINSNNLININENFTKLDEEKNLNQLIGLNRIGPTKYMNATIQCLSQTIPLTNYFLDEKNKRKINNKNISNLQLTRVYLELIEKLWEKKGPNSISPNNFKKFIEKIYPKQKYENLGFSKDFILFILEKLHNELKIFTNNINLIEMNQPINKYDRINSFNHFKNEFQDESSIISEIFFGILETNSVCLNCQNTYNLQGNNPQITYNYQTFNCILFNLDEVRASNPYLSNFQIEANKIISLDDCFCHFQKTEIVKNDTNNLCNVCKQKGDILYTTNIYSSPNVLILIILREKNNLSNIKLDFTETLDITKYVLQKEGKLIYNLYGVISQVIENNNSPYYIASCKNSSDQKWYRFYDDKISSITDVNIEVISYGKPCILFYKKNK